MILFFGLSLLLDLLNNARLPGSIKDAKGLLTHVNSSILAVLFSVWRTAQLQNSPFTPACFILPALGVIANYPAECNIAVNLNKW